MCVILRKGAHLGLDAWGTRLPGRSRQRFPEFPRFSMKSSRNSAKLSKRSSFSLCCNPAQRAFLWRSGGLGRLGASRVARMCWTATRPQPKEDSVKRPRGLASSWMACFANKWDHNINNNNSTLVSPFSIVDTVHSIFWMANRKVRFQRATRFKFQKDRNFTVLWRLMLGLAA